MQGEQHASSTNEIMTCLGEYLQLNVFRSKNVAKSLIFNPSRDRVLYCHNFIFFITVPHMSREMARMAVEGPGQDVVS